MNSLKSLFLILLAICAVFADIASIITPIVMVGTAGISVMYIVKNNLRIKKSKYYIIIYLNILSIVITSIFNFSSGNIKYIIYLMSMLLIMEIMEKKDLDSIFKIIYLFSIVLAIYLIIVGYKVNAIGNLSNVRNYIIFQKQSINMIFSVIIPYNIILVKDNKKIRYTITLIIFLIAGIFIMQIKSLIVTLPATFLAYEMINSRIKITAIFKFSIFAILATYIVYILDLIPQLTPIIDYLIYGNNSIYIGSKYLDTFILRKEILVFCFEILSTSLFWGIGYNNYHKYAVNKMFYVSSKGIFENYPTVTENGMMTFLVEGGIIGAITHISILIFTILDIKRVLRRVNNISLEEKGAILAFLSIVISNFMQDNLNFTYWLFIAINMNIVRRYSNKKVKLSNK